MIIFIVNIIGMLITGVLAILCALVLRNVKVNEKRLAEFENKMDVLIRVTAHHEFFIENVKKKSEEMTARNRKVR